MSTATNGSGVRYETCESGQTTDQMCSGETKEYYIQTKTLAFSTISDTTIDIEDATISYNTSTKNANGWYFNKTTMESYDDGTVVWLPHSTHTAPLCSRNWGDKSTTNEIFFTITPAAAGQICFWWKGESESGYDKFTFQFNGTTIYDAISGYYSTYQQWCGNVYGGTPYTFYFKYTKDGSKNVGIDMFCIDDITVPVAQPSSNPSNMTCSNCKKTGKCYSYCGDGTTQSDYEICDKYNGTANSNDWAQDKHCNKYCSGWGPYCGDGVKQSQEICDGSDTTYCYESYQEQYCSDTDFWGNCEEYSWRTRYYYYSVPCKTGCVWNPSSKTLSSSGNTSTNGYSYCGSM